jgi:cell division protein ZapA (FtsZ GTPase activity inhibitor)
MDELTITVNIAERPYRLKILRKEEEMVRSAVKEINDKIRGYSNTYAFNDKQDLLAMTALHLGTLSIRLEKEKTNQQEVVIQKLEALQDLFV